MTHVQLLFSLFPWALAMCQALCKAQISGHPSFEAFTAPWEMERVAQPNVEDPHSSKFPRDHEKGEVNAVWQ